MQTRLLWINLDPSWQFARMVQDHCLDLAVRDDCRVWDLDAGGRQADMRSRAPWSDWPRAVAAEHLLTDLDELLSQRAGGLLIALHLPAFEHAAPADAATTAGESGTGDAEPAGGQRLAEAIVARLNGNADARMLLTLPSAAAIEPIAERLPERVRLRRLHDDPRHNPRGAILALRLLLELHLDPAQADPRTARTADCRLVPDQRQPIRDRFASQWRELLPRLRAEVASLRRAVIARPAGTDPRDLIEQALASVAQLRDLPGGPALEPPAAAIEPLRPRLPLFHNRRLVERLDTLRIGFLERLDTYLTERFEALEQDHLQRQRAATIADERLERDLLGLTPATVGFGSDGQNWLDYRSDQLRTERETTLKQGQALVADMERDLRSRAHRRCGHYERHRFDEDDAFDDAVTQAKRAADDLMRRPTLTWTWLTGTACMLVPILSARLPGWIDAGILSYLTTPAHWLTDLGWLLAPGSLFVGLALFQAIRRRRTLTVAMARLQQHARGLWHRHAQVLGQTFTLTGLGLAMRRLDLIQGRLLRLEGDLRSRRDDLDDLDRLFRQQQQDYAALVPGGDAPRPSNEPQAITASLIEALAQGDSAEDWVAELVGGLPLPVPERIEVEDWSLSGRYPFETRVIRGCALLALERPHT